MLNADAIVGQTGDLLGHNMFAYCKNNPVNMEDEDGYWANYLIGAIVGVATTYVTDVVVNTLENGKFDRSCLKPKSSVGEYVKAALVGSLSGGLKFGDGARIATKFAKTAAKEILVNTAGSLANQGIDSYIEMGKASISKSQILNDNISGIMASGLSKAFGELKPVKQYASRQVMRQVNRKTGRTITAQIRSVNRFNRFMKETFGGVG